MKTKIILGSLLWLLTANNSFSQTDSKISDNDYAMAIVKDMPGSFATGSAIDASSLVNEKVKETFDQKFLGASGLMWQVNGKKAYASFWKDQLFHSALFKKNGTLVWSIVYVPQQKLPAELIQRIKSQYFLQCTPEDYAITFAADVTINNRNIWVVKLENEQEILTLRSEDNNLQLAGVDKK